MQNFTNWAKSTVATPPSPATSGTSLTVAAGEGAKFPSGLVTLVVHPSGVEPTSANAEIVWVTSRSGDTLNIARAKEGTTAKSIAAGWTISLAYTAENLGMAASLAGAAGTGRATTAPTNEAFRHAYTSLGVRSPLASITANAANAGENPSAPWYTTSGAQPVWDIAGGSGWKRAASTSSMICTWAGDGYASQAAPRECGVSALVQASGSFTLGVGFWYSTVTPSVNVSAAGAITFSGFVSAPHWLVGAGAAVQVNDIVSFRRSGVMYWFAATSGAGVHRALAVIPSTLSELSPGGSTEVRFLDANVKLGNVNSWAFA